jgi:hypothetical protein
MEPEGPTSMGTTNLDQIVSWFYAPPILKILSPNIHHNTTLQLTFWSF